jgi:hypothetical protein
LIILLLAAAVQVLLLALREAPQAAVVVQVGFVLLHLNL